MENCAGRSITLDVGELRRIVALGLSLPVQATFALVSALGLLIPFVLVLIWWTGGSLTLEAPLVIWIASIGVSASVIGWFAALWLRSRCTVTRRLLTGTLALVWLAAWVIGSAALLVAELTPLCIGQDNGDGNNTLSMCVGYAVLWIGLFTVLMIVPASLVAIVASRLLLPVFAPR